MHCKNEKQMNSNGNHSTTTSCSSSTDSGVIIIDNKTSFNNNNCNGNNINSNTHSYKDNTSDYETRNDAAAHEERLNNTNNIKQSDKSNKSNHLNIENIINITKTPHRKNDDAEVHRRQKQSQSPGNSSGRSSKNCSPTFSIRSTTISIVSIDENAIDSSVVDSDSEYEADAEGVHSNYVVKKLGQQTTYSPGSPDLPNINSGLTVISQNISQQNGTGPGPLAENILNGQLCPPAGMGALATPSSAQIGSIALTNSTDVTFGDKHFYEGPVTIQQFLIDNRDKRKPNDGDGQDNPMFAHEHGKKESDNDGAAPKADSPPLQQPYKFNRKAIVITGTIIVLTILTGILILTANVLNTSSKSKQLGDGDDSRKNIPINSTIEIPDDDDFDGPLELVKRIEWKGRDAKQTLDKLKLPIHRVIISHTASETCYQLDICADRVRTIQSFHMEKPLNWDDIGYNFLVGGDGRVYVGRGWDDQGAHTKGYNADSVGISFIGTFTNSQPTKKQIAAAKLLIDRGVLLQKLAPNYRIYGARQFGATESPGEALYRIIKDWPHWTHQI